MSRDSEVCKLGNNCELRNIYWNKGHEDDEAAVHFLRQKPQSNALRAPLCATGFNPGRKGFVQRPEDWLWSSYKNFALDNEEVRHCPLQIDYVRLPESYRG